MQRSDTLAHSAQHAGTFRKTLYACLALCAVCGVVVLLWALQVPVQQSQARSAEARASQTVQRRLKSEPGQAQSTQTLLGVGDGHRSTPDFGGSEAHSLPPGPFKAFIGIFTSLGGDQHALRRKAIRETWLEQAAATDGFLVRFVVGQPTPDQRALLRQEQQAHGDMLVLDFEECDLCQANKSMAFFTTAAKAMNVEYIVKLDDDVFLIPQRLSAALQQWRAMSAEYVGCMKGGIVISNPQEQWYEPAALLMGSQYHLYAEGHIYALAGQVAKELLVPNAHLLRRLANEDTSMGLWMVAFEVNYFDDRRLCQVSCLESAVAVLQPVACELEAHCTPTQDAYKLMNEPLCKQEVPLPLPYLPSHPNYGVFNAMHT